MRAPMVASVLVVLLGVATTCAMAAVPTGQAAKPATGKPAAVAPAKPATATQATLTKHATPGKTASAGSKPAVPPKRTGAGARAGDGQFDALASDAPTINQFATGRRMLNIPTLTITKPAAAVKPATAATLAITISFVKPVFTKSVVTKPAASTPPAGAQAAAASGRSAAAGPQPAAQSGAGARAGIGQFEFLSPDAPSLNPYAYRASAGKK